MDCPICGGTRWKSVEVDGTERLVRCDCWRTEVVEQVLRDARIPPRYARAELSNFEGGSNAKRDAFRLAKQFVNAFPAVDRGLLFYGPQGVGKTHLAIGILKEAIRSKGARSGFFFETKDLLRMVRDTYNRSVEETEMEVLGPVLNADLLVLDDLGSEKTSEWVQETLGLVVNTRYNKKLLTIFTSNLDDGLENTDPRSFIYQLGARTRSRLKEMCEWVRVDGQDVRELGMDATPEEIVQWDKKSPASPANLPKGPRPKSMARARLKESGQFELNWSGGKAGSK